MCEMKRSRALKLVDPRRHPEPKLRRMAEIVAIRVEREKREAALAKAAATREALHENGVTEHAGESKTDSDSTDPVTPAPASSEHVKTEEETETEQHVPPSEEAIAEMQEELETLQKKKHLLFVRLKDMLREEEQKKAAAEAERQERLQLEQQRLEEEERRCAHSDKRGSPIMSRPDHFLPARKPRARIAVLARSSQCRSTNALCSLDSLSRPARHMATAWTLAGEDPRGLRLIALCSPPAAGSLAAALRCSRAGHRCTIRSIVPLPRRAQFTRTAHPCRQHRDKGVMQAQRSLATALQRPQLLVKASDAL